MQYLARSLHALKTLCFEPYLLDCRWAAWMNGLASHLILVDTLVVEGSTDGAGQRLNPRRTTKRKPVCLEWVQFSMVNSCYRSK